MNLPTTSTLTQKIQLFWGDLGFSLECLGWPGVVKLTGAISPPLSKELKKSG